MSGFDPDTAIKALVQEMVEKIAEASHCTPDDVLEQLSAFRTPMDAAAFETMLVGYQTYEMVLDPAPGAEEAP